MIASLPPAPPAVFMTLAQAQALGQTAPASSNVKTVSRAETMTVKRAPAGRIVWNPSMGFKLGRKTKGRRDASLRLRSGRRK
jgi:hypothetical protein